MTTDPTETDTLIGSPCSTDKSCASPEVDSARDDHAPEVHDYRPGLYQPSTSSWASRRRNVVWAGRLGLLGLAVAAYLATSFRPPRTYTCPNPLAEPLSTPSLEDRSSAVLIPTLSPSFTLALARDLSTCNTFEVLISRTDVERCRRAEYEIEPSLDEELNQWIKSRLGPDTLAVQLDGAERQLLDVPSEYLGNCSYAYRFSLVNAGPVWVTVELLHEDYEGFMEPRELLKTRPAPVLVRQPLVDGPIKLDLCPSSCPPFTPPHVVPRELVLEPSSFDTSLIVDPAVEASSPSQLPSCDSTSSFAGAYLPLPPYALAHPRARLPESTHSTAARRSSAGQYTYHRPSCSMNHAGVRFADHTPCLASGHKALFLGDSHARVVYDVIKWRLEGHDDFALESPKELLKNGTVGSLGLYFKWDSYFDQKLSCDYFDQFDSITLSTGSHPACFKCPPTSQWVKQIDTRLHELADLLRTCPTQKPRSLLLFTLPTFPPEIGRNDCRTGPRMHKWSEELRRMAREQGEWQIVDVERYSRPVQDDVRLFDGIHFLRTDAIDPVVDEIIARLGFCSSALSVDEPIA
ncbi:hypothetical protein JCM8208_007605 [Rhodotorula glutinis]